jgi:poly(A) polymerase
MDDDHGVDEAGHRVLDEHGRILRDNLYGSIEEDVWRRDFTANALYYNIEDYSIWDYVGGVPDAEARVLRMIGDAETRYREDPVRMLRAARFAAKLDFTLHPDTEAPLHRLAYMLDSVPSARLFDETTKLLLAGSAVASFDLLTRLGLLAHLMPDVAAAVTEAPDSPGAKLLRLGLENTDARVRADKSVTPTFLFAVLLWPAILRAAGAAHGPLPSDPQVLLTACDEVLGRQLRRISVPKRFSLPMRDLIMLQPRFERRAGRRALRLLEHPKFRAAYDLLLLRAAAGEIDPELADWWTRLQALPETERVTEVEARPAEATEASPSRRRSRSRRRRKRPAAT